MKRDLTINEFNQLIEILKSRKDPVHSYWASAYFTFQYHIIGRIDDVAHFEKKNLKTHIDFDFALQVEVRWSKNIREERQVARQILLACNNPSYCNFLSLAIYLEVFLKIGDVKSSKYLFGGISISADNTKNRAASIFMSIMNCNEFKIDENRGDDLGTHSIRKYATTRATASGCTLDEVEVCGRWKNNGNRTCTR